MKQSIAWLLALSTSIAVASTATGCGGDDSPGSGGSGGSGGSSSGGSGGSGKAGTAGSSATGGSGGSGGSAGKAGSGGTAGAPADSGPDATTVMCGSKICTDSNWMGLPVLPCCAMGEATDTCGLLLVTACMTTTPGTPDPSCLSVVTPLGTWPGCCSATGVCGADLGAPLGCNDFSGLTGGVPTPCGADAAPPPPRDSGTTDVTPPPSDTGPGADTGSTDTSNGDTSSGDTGSSDTGTTDGNRGDTSDGGVTDASGDRSG
jgi:hypothetical protein